MVISDYPIASFCQDDEPMTLSNLTTDIDIAYSISDGDIVVDEFDEHYSPNNQGVVTLNGLGQLAMGYFSTPTIRFDARTEWSGGVRIDGVVKDADTGEQIGHFSRRFYYANCRTSIDDPWKFRGFLSRFHRRTVTPEQAIILSWFDINQSLGIGIMCGDEWIEVTPYETETSHHLMVDIWSLDRLAALDTRLKADEIKYAIFYLYNGSETLDAIQFDIDRSNKVVKTHFLFYNAFGVPESLCFTGQDKRSVEMQAEFAVAGREYRKIGTDFSVFHDVNTGYINQVTRETAEDLAVSRMAWTYQGRELLDKITITEVKFEESKPRTEPVNVSVKYRVTNQVQRIIDRDMTINYRIFDHTFGPQFE